MVSEPLAHTGRVSRRRGRLDVAQRARLRALGIVAPTYLIALGGFTHVIVGTIEAAILFFAGKMSLLQAIFTFLFFAGPRIATQVSQVTDALPDAWDEVKNALKDNGWGHYILDSTPLSDDGPDLNVMGALEGTLSTTLSVLVNLVVVVTVGIYLAIDPKLYRVGVQHLFPKAHRERSGEILDALGDGLWYWLLGQFVDMAAVAIMTGAGLWLLGVPLPVALGVIAGVTNFIPYLGPFIGAAPAVVIAFAHDPMLALYAAGLFLVVQQLDSHVMMPIIQEHATAMPPALTILVVVAAGVLFGLLGVLLATPLLLVALILVQRVYVEDVLQDHDVEEVGG